METTTAADGTPIAYEVEGSGPPLVIVTGAFCDRGTSRELAALLAPHLTVLRYDRRGRGGSGDAAPYAPEREVEDLAAVLDAAGGSASVYGHSSGAALALEAAAAGLPVTRLAAYEPPYGPEPGSSDELDEIEERLAAGDREGAVRRFLGDIVPPEVLATAHEWPDWPAMVGIAHTLPYDLRLVGNGTVPERFAGIDVPTLVLHGSESDEWLQGGAALVVDAVPGATGRVVPGQDHGVAPEAVAPELLAWFRPA